MGGGRSAEVATETVNEWSVELPPGKLAASGFPMMNVMVWADHA